MGFKDKLFGQFFERDLSLEVTLKSSKVKKKYWKLSLWIKLATNFILITMTASNFNSFKKKKKTSNFNIYLDTSWTFFFLHPKIVSHEFFKATNWSWLIQSKNIIGTLSYSLIFAYALLVAVYSTTINVTVWE